jgi:hypothetical protein
MPSRSLVTTTLAAVFAIVPFAASADDCDAAWAAVRAGMQKPHSSTIMTRNGDARKNINYSVTTADKVYVEKDRDWYARPWNAAKLIADLDSKLKKTKCTCNRVGEESVDGQPATLYTVHEESEGSVSDNKIWVSDALGVPIKSESHVDDLVTTTTNDYVNVHVPEARVTELR